MMDYQWRAGRDNTIRTYILEASTHVKSLTQRMRRSHCCALGKLFGIVFMSLAHNNDRLISASQKILQNFRHYHEDKSPLVCSVHCTWI